MEWHLKFYQPSASNVKKMTLHMLQLRECIPKDGMVVCHGYIVSEVRGPSESVTISSSLVDEY